MTDIVERLQECLDMASLDNVSGKYPVRQEVLTDAKVEIETLRAKVAGLKELMEPHQVLVHMNDGTWQVCGTGYIPDE